MGLSKLSVHRPVTTVMMILIVVLIGTVSLGRLSIDLYPNIEIPVAVVSTSYSNVSPEEIETLITQPIEEALGTVANVDTIQSMSSEGSSVVIVQFDFGIDMDNATLKMRENVDLVKDFLPEGASDPMVFQFDINSMPIVQAAVTGSDLASLQEYAEDTLKPALERNEGVASVSVSGGYDNYVSVQVDTEKMIGYGLSFDSLSQSLTANNLNLPAGVVDKGDREILVRTVGEFQDLDEIKNTPIMLNTGGKIQLSDIAEVSIQSEEVDTITKLNGKPAVSISVQKQSGTNTVAVANTIEEVLKDQAGLTNYSVSIITDQSDYIEDSISQVAGNALIGGLLAILVLYIFLRNIRSTLIIGLSIPISIIATFILIYFNDITLNLMTLGGLALGIGMLVDNSVVVLENIYRFRQDGYSKIEAAIKGAGEVAMSVTASTLTTVAVFLPMVFVEGVTSIMFRELALTVTFSLLSSLVVSLTLIPMMASQILHVDMQQGKHHETKNKTYGHILDVTDSLYAKLDLQYQKMLKWSLHHRKSVVVLALVFFIGSVASIPLIGTEYFPTADEGQFAINFELEDGVKSADAAIYIDEVFSRIEDIEDIERLYSTTGGGSTMGMGSGSAQIDGVLVPMNQRDRSVFEVIEEVEERIKDIPGVKLSVAATSTSAMSIGGGTAISVQVKGNDYDVLADIAEDFVSLMKGVEGTKNVSSSLADSVPQVIVDLDDQRAMQFGLTTFQVANAVKSIMDGKQATTFTTDGGEISVVLESEGQYTESISNLKQVLITTPMGSTIPLDVIADVTIEDGPIQLDRVNQSRTVTVSSDLEGRDLGSVTADIEALLEEYSMPRGYIYEMGGQNQEMVEAFSDLFLALALAVLLIYMILASQFESLFVPFIIMFSTPLAFAGGLFGLFITNRTINITSLIGFIMLSGIVVNNAIVLIDYINTRRGFGEERDEAILKAGPIRLRPILMTTLTTVLAMLPLGLGIGAGAELQAPMATVIIAGLFLATLLTLIFIPVLYTILDDTANKIKGRKKGREANIV